MSQPLKAKEVSRLLGMSAKWVYQNQFQIPGRFTIGKSIFWDKETLLRSIKEQASRPAVRLGRDRHDLT